MTLHRDAHGFIKFPLGDDPADVVAEVLTNHHPLFYEKQQVHCYCGHIEERRRAYGGSADGLDLHRAEVMFQEFRVEDA